MKPKLPNFLVIGAARAGTTSLYHALSEHPEIYMPTRKEPHFFSEHWGLGMDYYLPLWADAGEQPARGEASVSYSYRDRPAVAERIADVLGRDTRIIYLVRQPSERLFSHYLYYRYTGMKEHDELGDAIERNPVYREGSRYGSWLKLYRDTFGTDNVLVVPFEDLSDDATAVAQRVFGFLGVAAGFEPQHQKATNRRFAPRNEAVYRVYRRFAASRARRLAEGLIPQHLRPRLRGVVHGLLGSQRRLPTLSADDKRRLDREFLPEVEQLSELTQIDFVDRWMGPRGQ